MSQPGQPWSNPGPQWDATAQQWVQPGQYPGGPQQHVPPGYAPGPWGATTQRRGNAAFDAFLTGDWLGALLAAGLAVAAMLLVSLVGMLLVSETDLGFHETLVLIVGGVCLAVGGDAFFDGDVSYDPYGDSDSGGDFGGGFSVGFLPLTVTVVGLVVLGLVFARRLRARNVATGRDVSFAVVRTMLVFALLFVPLSLVSHYTPDRAEDVFSDDGFLSAGGRWGVGVASSVFGALLFALAVTGLVWLLRSSAPALGRFRPSVFPALMAALLVFAVGFLGSLVALIVALDEAGDGETPAVLGVLLLGFVNLALASPLLASGVPVAAEGSFSGEFGSSGGSFGGSSSAGLLTLTDYNGWFWLAPVLLLVVVLGFAVVLVLRQQTLAAARLEGLRFAGLLALVAFAAALLLRISYDLSAAGSGVFYGEGSGDVGSFGGGLSSSVTFNPFLAAVIVFLWGAVLGQVAPVLAAKASPGFVHGVRRRFGVAPMPQPRPQAAAPVPPPAYGYAPPAEYGYPSPPQHPPAQEPFPQQPIQPPYSDGRPGQPPAGPSVG